MKSIYSNETLTLSIYQTQSYNAVTAFNDVLTGTERILNTPLPIAYSIAISQITWVYILILPFQLFDYLGWVTIPASLCAGYIILGIALIGQEIENPFGTDVNDLSLDAFCEQIRRDVDVVVSRPAPRFEDVVRSGNNALLWPVIRGGYEMWNAKTVEEIREALGRKVQVDFDAGRHRHRHDESRMKERSEKNGGATGAVV